MSRVLILGGCGYLGSALNLHLNERGHTVQCVDLEWFGNPARITNIRKDYAALTPAELADFDAVVLVAAHSSAPMCRNDRLGALRNNVLNFVELLAKLSTQKLIYASSSCVYHGTQSVPIQEEWAFCNPSDDLSLTKTVVDRYAEMSDVECYGLRFGSVNGYSPNFRCDLVINRMTYDAMNSGVVRVSNPSVHRPVLGIRDLVRAVDAVIEGPDRRGIYNVASFNMTVGAIGQAIAARLGADFKEVDGAPTYDFSISSARFESTFGFRCQETLQSIVDSLIEHRMQLQLTDRSAPPSTVNTHV